MKNRPDYMIKNHTNNKTPKGYERAEQIKIGVQFQKHYSPLLTIAARHFYGSINIIKPVALKAGCASVSMLMRLELASETYSVIV